MVHLTDQQFGAIKAQGKWSRKIPFNKEAMKLLLNKQGMYEMFDKNGNKIYVGVTYNGLRHRVSSYLQKDDFNKGEGHPTKKELRPLIAEFRIKYCPIDQARKHEERIKQTTPFNMDSHKHEMEKKENGV